MRGQEGGPDRLVNPKTYRMSAHTNTHTHPNNPARKGGRQEEGAHRHTHPNTPGRSGAALPKSEPKYTHPERTPQPGLAGYKRSAHTNTHRPQHPSQEWRGAAETRAQAHTPTPHTPARIGGVQAECAHNHTPQSGMAGRSRNLSQSTHSNTAQPTQDSWGTGGSGHTNTHRPQLPSQEWRGAAETGAQAQTPTPRTPARLAWYKPSAHTNTHTPQHRSQKWRGSAET